VTILNTLAFTKQVKLHGIAKSLEQEDQEIVQQVMDGTIEVRQAGSVLTPEYTNDPKITVSKKDYLNRKK
jgi:hypothetical protein